MKTTLALLVGMLLLLTEAQSAVLCVGAGGEIRWRATSYS